MQAQNGDLEGLLATAMSQINEAVRVMGSAKKSLFKKNEEGERPR